MSSPQSIEKERQGTEEKKNEAEVPLGRRGDWRGWRNERNRIAQIDASSELGSQERPWAAVVSCAREQHRSWKTWAREDGQGQ
jgi:hypothetical protein